MTIAPLISSTQQGPLGVCHLPRLWCKVLLHGAGLLPEGYRYGIGGFDEDLCEALAIDATRFVAFVQGERPDYLACEAWVRAHSAGLDAAKIAAFNEYVAARELPPERAAPRRSALGLNDSTLSSAVALNDLEDWQYFHATLPSAATA